MTAQLLAAELSTLIQDTKRKAPDVRNAAERSLTDLRSLPNTSESQLAADLRRRPDFVKPFLLACKASSVKYAGSSVLSLQRLVAINGLSPERLEELLEALRECSGLGSDIQLRVLQIMPSLFQRYGEQITESRLATALQVCFVLQAAKNAMISHTAAATLQQVVNDVFSRIHSDKAISEAISPESSRTSWQAELDCHHVLQDLCLIAQGKSVESLRKANVSSDFALELIGTILLNHTSIIPRYTNFIDILRQQLLPFMLRVISAAGAFSTTARVLRLVPPVIQSLLDILPTELEMLLSMLTHMLEADAAPRWKRTMCMEALRDIYKENSNLRRMYIVFDQEADHKPIVKDQLAMLGRLANEEPSVIGWGKVSSLPTSTEQNDEDMEGLAALQADPLTATAGVSLTTRTAMNTGISRELSSLKVSLVDQLDKSEPPSIPPSYIYALVLTSLNLLSDGLARFVLPFASSTSKKTIATRDEEADKDEDTSEDETSRYQIPSNPIDLVGHEDYAQIQATADLVKNSWPAILSTYSTFFQSALDSEYYHATIRAFQNLIQVTTLFRLALPRDAFLTALSNQSLPADNNLRTARPTAGNGANSIPRLSGRNLLCLRALLNLGIALGSVLDEAWSIVLSTLQQADIVVGHISTDRTLSRGGPASISPSVSTTGEMSREFTGEMAAVRSAASRMLQSASELPPEQFLAFVACATNLLRGVNAAESNEGLCSEQAGSGHHDESDRTEDINEIRGNVFVIDLFSQMIDLNHERFGNDRPSESGWASTVDALLKLVQYQEADPELRIASVDTICKSITVATFTNGVDSPMSSLVPYALSILNRLVFVVHQRRTSTSDAKAEVETIHRLSLQTLKACLDRYGDAITEGWKDICKLILSAFLQSETETDPRSTASSQIPHTQALLRLSFESLQLICSDLLECVPDACLTDISQAVHNCCSQAMDLNIALTSTSLYQKISDHIWSGQLQLNIPRAVPKISQTMSRADRWMSLLAAVVCLTDVEQPEVKNNAVHACFRIVASVEDKLNSSDWEACINHVLLELYRQNDHEWNRLNSDDIPQSKAAVLNETAAGIHQGVCGIWEEHSTVILRGDKAAVLWGDFLSCSEALLRRSSLILSTNVYLGLGKIFSSLEDEDATFTHFTQPAWHVWLSHIPTTHIRLDRPRSSDNQTALEAYITCATELYKVSDARQKSTILADLLASVASCVRDSTPVSYAVDLASVTALQGACLHLLELVFTNISQVHSLELRDGVCADISVFASHISHLLRLTLSKKSNELSNQGPTFVAFTSQILDVFERLLQQKAATCSLYSDSEVAHCLRSLYDIIEEKRVWTREEKTFTVWHRAATAFLESSSRLLTLSLDYEMTDVGIKIWGIASDIFRATLSEGTSPLSEAQVQPGDLQFDIDAFNRICHFFIPNLGSSTLPSEERVKFAEILFKRSIIHDPHPDDSLDPIHTVPWPNPMRIGRVRDLQPDRRSKLCYLALNRMFDLVSQSSSSKEHAALAAAAVPFLQLRVELVLKAYISDQPLRGRMPCPLSQKQELIHVMTRTAQLTDTELSSGESTASNVLGQGIIRRLKGLAIMALRVAIRDERVVDTLLRFMEIATALG